MNNEEMKYMTVAEFAGKIGVHPQTIRKWDKENVLKPHHVLPSGRRLYSEDQVDNMLKKEIIK